MSDNEDEKNIDVSKKMSEVLSTLTPKEVAVLKARFGIDASDPRSLEKAYLYDGSIADRIKEIEEKALSKLRDRDESGKARCSFCGKSEVRVKSIVKSGAGANICSECLKLCDDILEED